MIKLTCPNCDIVRYSAYGNHHCPRCGVLMDEPDVPYLEEETGIKIERGNPAPAKINKERREKNGLKPVPGVATEKKG